MKILYIGTPHNHDLWKEGKNPSHWLYGACEMEEEGHEVIWAQERYNIFNDLKLIKQYNPDIIFIPNLNLHVPAAICTFLLRNMAVRCFQQNTNTNFCLFTSCTKYKQ